jgi:photosystem II stability/assembly factor-like uncharacterized protein
MKKFVLILFGGLLLGCTKDNPVTISSTKPNEELNTICIPINISGPTSVFFVSDSYGYITGYNGAVYKTLDNGRTWITLITNTTLPLFGIWFFDQNEGFVAGGENSCGGTGCTPRGGIILHTTNGGISWDTSFVPSAKIEILSIYFIDSSGFAVGGNTILSTTNRGKSWKETQITSVYGMRNVNFATKSKGYLACFTGSVLRTDNAGTDWNIVNSTGSGYYSISVVDENTFYISGQLKIVKSINSGTTLEELANSPTDIFALHFSDNKTGFAFGRGGWSGGDFGHTYGTIYTTDDGGVTWTGGTINQTSGLIESVSFTSSHEGYALCGNTLIRFHK